MKAMPLILLITLISCERKKYFSDKIIETWITNESPIPSKYSGLYMFVRGESNHIGIGDLGSLHRLFVNDFSDEYSSYDNFVKAALNDHVRFEDDMLDRSGWVVSDIDIALEQSYKEHGIDALIHEIDRGGGGQLVIKPKKFSSSELYTLIYLLFLNNYTITMDDYIGVYFAELRGD